MMMMTTTMTMTMMMIYDDDDDEDDDDNDKTCPLKYHLNRAMQKYIAQVGKRLATRRSAIDRIPGVGNGVSAVDELRG